MADAKISALPASTTPLAGTEVLPIVQSSTTKKVSVSDLTAGRSVGATSFVPSGSAVPTNGVYLPATNAVGVASNSTERMRIHASGGVSIGNTTDAGAGNVSINGLLRVVGSAISQGFGNTLQSVTLNGSVSANDYKVASSLADVNANSILSLNTTVNTGVKLLAGITNGYNGYIQALNATTTASLPLSLQPYGGNVVIGTGDLVIGTSGKGLDFGSSVLWRTGAGSPEGVVTAAVGSLYTRTDGGLLTTLYVKESGAGNTGWVGK